MFLSKLIKDFQRVQTSVISNVSWDNFKGLSERVDDELLLSADGSGVLSKVS